MATVRRFLAAFFVLLMMGAFAANAFAEENDAQQADTPATDGEMGAANADATNDGTRLLRLDVIDLGKVPEETATEENCEVILVADVATGVPIHEKNISVRVPVGGATVQLMTALVVLDHLSMDETIQMREEVLDELPTGKPKLGLSARNTVMVSDLIASMLYNGDIDSAFVLAAEAAKRAKENSFAAMMVLKANELGMLDTDYSNCDGTGLDAVQTTAVDQCELYMEALNTPAISDILQAGARDFQWSEEAWPTFDDKEAEREREALQKTNSNLPKRVVNDVSAVVPENRLYDVRLSSAVSCTVKTPRKNENDKYNAVFVHCVDYRTDMVMLYWTKATSNTIMIKPMTNLADIFSRRKIVDMIPYIEVAANAMTVEKNGVSVSGWVLTGGHVIYGRQMASYDPDAKKQDTSNDFDLAKMSVVLRPESSTMVLNDDGSRTMQAKVMVNNSVEGTVTLATAPKPTQTSVSQNVNSLYTEEDVMPEEPTLMSQYGWMIIIAGVVILALIVIIIGLVIRNRMERW